MYVLVYREEGRLDEGTRRRGVEHLRSMRLIASGSAALPVTLFRSVHLQKQVMSEVQELPTGTSNTWFQLRCLVCLSSCLTIFWVRSELESVTGQPPVERYGMTELGMVLSNDATQPHRRVPG